MKHYILGLFFTFLITTFAHANPFTTIKLRHFNESIEVFTNTIKHSENYSTATLSKDLVINENGLYFVSRAGYFIKYYRSNNLFSVWTQDGFILLDGKKVNFDRIEFHESGPVSTLGSSSYSPQTIPWRNEYGNFNCKLMSGSEFELFPDGRYKLCNTDSPSVFRMPTGDMLTVSAFSLYNNNKPRQIYIDGPGEIAVGCSSEPSSTILLDDPGSYFFDLNGEVSVIQFKQPKNAKYKGSIFQNYQFFVKNCKLYSKIAFDISGSTLVNGGNLMSSVDVLRPYSPSIVSQLKKVCKLLGYSDSDDLFGIFGVNTSSTPLQVLRSGLYYDISTGSKVTLVRGDQYYSVEARCPEIAEFSL